MFKRIKEKVSLFEIYYSRDEGIFRIGFFWIALIVMLIIKSILNV